MRHFWVYGTLIGLASGGCASEPAVTTATEAGTPAIILARGQDQYAAVQRHLEPYRAKLMENGYQPERLARFIAHMPREKWDYMRKVYTGEIRGVAFHAPEGSLLYEYGRTVFLTEAEGGSPASRPWPPKGRP